VQETAAGNAEGSSNKRVPKVGMNFLSEEEAYSFYNRYAEDEGFSVRRGSKHKVKNTNTIQQRTFFCSRQGMN
jgi:zinc finger SWIM domain-containing protein 3